VLTHELEPVYLDLLKQPLRDVATLMLDTGLRIGEVLSLTWQNVHFTPAKDARYGYLTVRASHAKNSKSRNIPLNRAFNVLINQSATDGYVFHRENGSRLYQTWLDEQHRAVRETLSLPEDFVLHSCRHTFGTQLGEAGADAFTIMKLMGHSTVTMSQKYVHPSPELLETAMNRLEALNQSKAQTPKRGVGTNLGTMGSSDEEKNAEVA
jgi:integrase